MVNSLETDGVMRSDTGYVESDTAYADAMMTLLGGTALASGDGAVTIGEVQLDTVNYGSYTVARGSATYTGQGGEAAHADTFVDVAGADLVYTYEFDYAYGYGGGFGSDSQYASYSKAYVFAIDFDAGDYIGDYYLNQSMASNPSAPWTVDNNNNIQVDGNVSDVAFTVDVLGEGENELSSVSVNTNVVGGSASVLDVNAQTEQGQLALAAEAFGIDTLTLAIGSVIEIEDHFSSVTGAVIAVA